MIHLLQSLQHPVVSHPGGSFSPELVEQIKSLKEIPDLIEGAEGEVKDEAQKLLGQLPDVSDGPEELMSLLDQLWQEGLEVPDEVEEMCWKVEVQSACPSQSQKHTLSLQRLSLCG